MAKHIKDIAGNTPVLNYNDIYLKLEYLYQKLFKYIKDNENYDVIISNGDLALSYMAFNNKKRVCIIPQHLQNPLKLFEVDLVRTEWNSLGKESPPNLATRLGTNVLNEYEYVNRDLVRSFVEECQDYNIVLPLCNKMFLEIAKEFISRGKKVIGVVLEDTYFVKDYSELSNPSKIMYLPFPPPFKVKDIGFDVVVVKDSDAFKTCKELMSKGIMLGPLSGAVVSAALSKNLKDYLCLCLDSAYTYQQLIIENTKNVSKNVFQYTVADLDLPPVTSVNENTLVKEALETMLENDFDQVPVITDQKKMVGFVTLGHLETLVKMNNVYDEAVKNWMYKFEKKKYMKITLETNLEYLQKFFEDNSVAFITDEACKWVLGVCTKYDLIKFAERIPNKI